MNETQKEYDFTPLLKVRDVASILGICQSFAYRLIQHGDIPSVRMGRSVRVHPKELNDYIEQQSKLS